MSWVDSATEGSLFHSYCTLYMYKFNLSTIIHSCSGYILPVDSFRYIANPGGSSVKAYSSNNFSDDSFIDIMLYVKCLLNVLNIVYLYTNSIQALSPL